VTLVKTRDGHSGIWENAMNSWQTLKRVSNVTSST